MYIYNISLNSSQNEKYIRKKVTQKIKTHPGVYGAVKYSSTHS